MKIKTLILGPLDNNCYILEKGNDVIVIDPASEFLKIKEEISNKNLLCILITHRHFDHIGALKEMISNYNVKVFEGNNLDEKNYEIGPFKFEVIKTKGHSSDSVTFYFYEEDAMFTGDFLFKDSIGRYDFEDSSYIEMLKSIKKIKKYKNANVYPGHGASTTLDYEKENNVFLKASN